MAGSHCLLGMHFQHKVPLGVPRHIQGDRSFTFRQTTENFKMAVFCFIDR